MLNVIAAAATISGLLAGLLPTVQIRKILRLRSSRGISLPYLGGVLANNLVWMAYGIAFPRVSLILPNALTVLMNGTMLAIAIRFRPRGEQPLAAVPTIAPARDDELAQAA
jgi:uncharacterized protein with PQ loop repeat